MRLGFEVSYEGEAGDEAADVGPPGDVGAGGDQGGGALQKLEEEPEGQEEQGGDMEDGEDGEEGNEGGDAGQREEHEVAAEHAGDGAAGADGGHGGAGVGVYLDGVGDEAAEEVVEDEARFAEAVFDVVAEDPQVPHVAEEVDPAAVEEEVGDEGQVGGGIERVAGHAGQEGGRHEAPGVHEGGEGRVAEDELLVEEVEVGEDEEDGGDRPGAGGDVVAEREHGGTSSRGNIFYFNARGTVLPVGLMEIFPAGDNIAGKTRQGVDGMQRFVPARAFFEPAAFDYPLGRKLYDRLRAMKVPVQMTGSHNRVTGLPGKTAGEAYREAKRTLVVGVRKSADFATCKPSAHFQLPLATSCPGMCEYCYLATTLGRRPYLRVYVNIDEVLAKAGAYIEERAPEITVFEGAATSDPLPTEYLTHLLYNTIEFFGREPLGRFRFVTKHCDVEPLLDAAHNGHTRFRFSLNAPSVIGRFEHRTPALEERVAAAARVAGADYPLGFIIAPIFAFPGWREEYGGLFRSLAAALPAAAGSDLTFEFITHRFTKKAKANITAVFPQTALPMDEEERTYKFGQFGYGKYLYDLETRRELEAFMREQVARFFPAAKVEYFV